MLVNEKLISCKPHLTKLAFALIAMPIEAGMSNPFICSVIG